MSKLHCFCYANRRVQHWSLRAAAESVSHGPTKDPRPLSLLGEPLFIISVADSYKVHGGGTASRGNHLLNSPTPTSLPQLEPLNSLPIFLRSDMNKL